VVWRLFRVLTGILAVIGLATVALTVSLGIAISHFKPAEKPLADRILLTVDLTKGLASGAGEDRLVRIVTGGEPTLRDFLDAIARAGDDPRVKGLFARVGTDNLGLAKIQEVRDAIAAFRAKGKFAIAFADSFGEFGPGTRPYYLATAFNEIWLQPMGTVGLIGLESQVPFVKGMLDLLGVKASFDHREEFKTAMNSLTETQMTPPHRAEVEGLLASLSGQIVGGIAKARTVPQAAVRQAIDAGPLSAAAALRAKLIDRVGYRDEALSRAHQRAGAGAVATSLSSYLDRAGRPDRHGPTIALIYGTGLVSRTGSETPLVGSETMAADELGRAFRAAARDPQVRAILFRIDSPGGSAVASETIWRDVVFARERGKPVVVSMGDLAASGGYYVAADANKIVAEPATLTGSIGVLAGKLVFAGLMQKLGVSVDGVAFGANAGMFDATADFSPEAHQRLEQFLDLTYQGFKDHVAQGRHMSQAAVEAVAKGRVWTGEDAKAKGLVDALGGYWTALRLAREAAHLKPDAPVTVTVFPRRQGIVERFVARLSGEEPNQATTGLLGLGPTLAAVRPLLLRLQAALDGPGGLLMPLGEVR
jgi:protease IV